MARKKRALPNVLAAFGFAPLVIPIVSNIDLDGTATRDFPLFKAPFKGRLRAATYTQELDADGTKDIKIRNFTKAVDLTAVLDIDALAADAGADFVLSTVDGDLIFNKGDLIAVVYTVTVAGTVAPGEASVTAAVEWIKD